MSEQSWPQPLAPVHGPFSTARLEGAATGMGPAGPATRSLIDDGFVPPDLVTGMTLFLLARQPRNAALLHSIAFCVAVASYS